MIVLDLDKPGSKRKIALSGSIDVRSASELHSALRDIVDRREEGVIDCTEVESLDAACIQLLWAAKRELPQSLTLVFKRDTEAARWLELAGLTHWLPPATSTPPALEVGPSVTRIEMARKT